MPHRPGVVLDEAVVAGGVGIAQFLPDPPLVVGPAPDVAPVSPLDDSTALAGPATTWKPGQGLASK